MMREAVDRRRASLASWLPSTWTRCTEVAAGGGPGGGAGDGAGVDVGAGEGAGGDGAVGSALWACAQLAAQQASSRAPERAQRVPDASRPGRWMSLHPVRGA
ncbi:MAG: hypothetical protein EBS47_12255 [Betaproteobacteria bacterium]|nr:hypothetical protein [Betaproteobacteria bacterium]